MQKLSSYAKRRNFSKTQEPKPQKAKNLSGSQEKKIRYVIQKHHATHLHYDLRLEMKGVLKSWALPKEPPKTNGIKRLAIETEDHPMAYAHFEGTIPEKEYGAGLVEIWDKGYCKNIKKTKDLKTIPWSTSYKKGILEFEIFGKKLKGKYVLVHLKDKQWLFFKKK
jgi:DNA ligase D-like protein (predicted 3'-phosphoesterase)